MLILVNLTEDRDYGVAILKNMPFIPRVGDVLSLYQTIATDGNTRYSAPFPFRVDSVEYAFDETNSYNEYSVIAIYVTCLDEAWVK